MAAAREQVRREPPGEYGPAMHTAQILFESARVREAAERLERQAGGIFLLWWKALSGSYLALTSASRW